MPRWQAVDRHREGLLEAHALWGPLENALRGAKVAQGLHVVLHGVVWHLGAWVEDLRQAVGRA
eukprot:11184879-Lingulodinium_polyedra.AAC.1